MRPEATNICGKNDLEITTGSTDETIDLGRRVGSVLEANDVVALSGPLGSGKTCLTKGIALGLGISDSRAVRSPTFIIINEYEGRLRLYHVDAYRLHGAEDFDSLGAGEFMFSDGVTVVEWSERVAAALPDEYLQVTCSHAGETCRTYSMLARGDRFTRLIDRLTTGK